MSDRRAGDREDLQSAVGARERRKLRARHRGERGLWFGLGMMGLIGWSVALPTIAGIALGVWMDHRWPGRLSWTLTLLAAGVALGCANAWYWIQKERPRD